MTNTLPGLRAERPTVPGPATTTAPLGVGLMHNASLPEFLRTNLDCIDYLEVIPDTFWTDAGPEAAPRFLEIPPYVEVLDWVADRTAVVAHHLGLSLGSAGSFDREYLGQLAHWQSKYTFAWHSDHLSFVRVPGDGGHAGAALPVPFDGEVLDLMVERIAEVQDAAPVPFLIENSVYFFQIPDQEFTEAEFLNELTRRSGCGLLLDVHNLYANARNHQFDPLSFLRALDLDAVGEFHIAGGSEFAGMWTDSHSGPCQEEVWQLLDWALPRCPNARGVTFEFHDSYYPVLGDDGVRAQLRRARHSWDRHR